MYIPTGLSSGSEVNIEIKVSMNGQVQSIFNESIVVGEPQQF